MRIPASYTPRRSPPRPNPMLHQLRQAAYNTTHLVSAEDLLPMGPALAFYNGPALRRPHDAATCGLKFRSLRTCRQARGLTTCANARRERNLGINARVSRTSPSSHDNAFPAQRPLHIHILKHQCGERRCRSHWTTNRPHWGLHPGLLVCKTYALPLSYRAMRAATSLQKFSRAARK